MGPADLVDFGQLFQTAQTLEMTGCDAVPCVFPGVGYTRRSLKSHASVLVVG